MVKRSASALDRAVVRYRDTGKKSIFEKIYYAIYPIVERLARKYLFLFPDRSADDLVQEAFLFITLKVIPKYDIERAGFKTIITLAVSRRFRQTYPNNRNIDNTKTITFTEYEKNTGDDSESFAGPNFIDEIVIDDFLRLFKSRLKKDDWKLYWRLYKDPKQSFKKLAKAKGIPMTSLYRKSQAIYSFLKMLVEKESE